MAVPVNNILFLDIETVPQYADYNSLPKDWKELWDTKATSLLKYHEEETKETIYHRAGIYAEFGKIICISCGRTNILVRRYWSTYSTYHKTQQEVLLHFLHKKILE